MTHAIRIHELGGPDVLRWETVEVGEPAAGELLAAAYRGRPELHRRVLPHGALPGPGAAIHPGHGGRRRGRGGR
ncbi:MAG: hypothetical protein U5K43_02815 [Halofilum sp. (in: g-proteobacteria)]|nr:hypothetical protein [Halofilum sp. (in: g-proteobacteria)]